MDDSRRSMARDTLLTTNGMTYSPMTPDKQKRNGGCPSFDASHRGQGLGSGYPNRDAIVARRNSRMHMPGGQCAMCRSLTALQTSANMAGWRARSSHAWDGPGRRARRVGGHVRWPGGTMDVTVTARSIRSPFEVFFERLVSAGGHTSPRSILLFRRQVAQNAGNIKMQSPFLLSLLFPPRCFIRPLCSLFIPR
jgi:hypothetical protein